MSLYSWSSTYITEDLRDLIGRASALVVIDMQNDFISEKGAISQAYGLNARSLNQNIKSIIEEFRRHSYPIFYTRMVYRPDYSDAGRRARSKALGALKEGSWGAQIVDNLTPAPSDYIINKQRASSFYQTNFDLLLRKLKISTLVLTGVATNVCVESTARDALFRDYDCIVLSDCVSTKDAQAQTASLNFMNEFTGLVTTSQNLLNAMKLSSPR